VALSDTPGGPPGSVRTVPDLGGESAAAEARRSSAAERSGAERSAPLPCQNSHNSTEDDLEGGYESRQACAEKVVKKALEFTASARRTAFALQLNVHAMCEAHGVSQIGFLTLTFSEHILDPKEAQRRLNSLTTHVLRPRYGRVIRVIERQKSGRIHYHLLVHVGADIRTGVDFDALERGDYRSAPQALRAEWSFWRRTAKRYGFGRTELLPVKSSSEAIGRYVGKYIAKHIEHREFRDRRVRLVSYSGVKVASTRFAWASPGAANWRRKVKAFVTMLYESGAIGSPTWSAMRLTFGARWAHYWRDSISTLPDAPV
jgi:hypothetical protein